MYTYNNKQKGMSPKHKFYIFSPGSRYTLLSCMMSRSTCCPYFEDTSPIFFFSCLVQPGFPKIIPMDIPTESVKSLFSPSNHLHWLVSQALFVIVITKTYVPWSTNHLISQKSPTHKVTWCNSNGNWYLCLNYRINCCAKVNNNERVDSSSKEREMAHESFIPSQKKKCSDYKIDWC